jgi:hypothetical protein
MRFAASFLVALFVALSTATFGCSSSDFNVASGDGGTDGSVDDGSIDGGSCTGTDCPCPDPTFRCGLKCVDRGTDVDHCGACAVKCPVPTGGTATCKVGICGIGCGTGTHACGATCDSDTSPNSCGPTSCTPCPSGANASPACSGGKCGLSCHAGFADCDGRSDDGCEVDLNTTANCGACGKACPAGNVCQPDPTGGGFSCSSTCTPPNLLCGASCVDITSDPAHCGGCSVACASDSHGEPTCGGTPPKCGVKCDDGFHACSGVCKATSDPTACGDGCVTCPSGAHSAPVCDPSVGKCGLTCESGFADCDGVPTNGCEVDLNSDPSNCSKCGEVCSAPTGGSPTCTLGGCGFSCNPGWAPLHSVGCAVFGGVAEQNAVAAGGGGTCALCQQSDPLAGTSSGCGCPSGFTAETLPLALAVPCGTSLSPGAESPLTFCYVPPPATLPPISTPPDFEGAFIEGDACGGGCAFPNPFTKVCGCPPDSKGLLTTDVQYVPPCGTVAITGKLGICLGPGFGPTFFGAFVNDNTGKCVASTGPVPSGPCTCPSGSGTAIKYPIEIAPTTSGTLVICYP